MKTTRLILLSLVALSCSHEQLRTANDVRAELCAMAPLLPASPELEYFKTTCAVGASLSQVAEAFERCESAAPLESPPVNATPALPAPLPSEQPTP
jgi:hypothetical protein